MKKTHQFKSSENSRQAASNRSASWVKNNPVVQLQDNRPKSVIQREANTTGLPDNLKTGVESLSGYSMNDVKVHYNSSRPVQLQAHAYAQGADIHIAPGQEKHLPHEAWHVVQQKQGRVKPTLQMKGKVNVNDDKGLEREADAMGAKALQMKNGRQEGSLNNSVRYFAVAGTPQRKAVGNYGKTAQLAWIESTEANHATQKWEPEVDGVTWFSDGMDIWFIISNAHNIRKGAAADYAQLEGYEHRRSLDKWNEISVEPSMEWVRQVNRGPKMTDKDHTALLANFQQKYGAGVKLWATLQKNLAQARAGAPDADTAHGYETRYNTDIQAGADLSVTAKQATNEEGGYFSVATTTKGLGHAAYSNFFHPGQGLIIADSNYAEKDAVAQVGGQPRLNNSEILFHQYKKSGGDLGNLKQVIRSNIANTKTQEILQLSQHSLADKMHERTWTPANKEFYALLGTDNVKGVTFLLGQHARETGGKTITSIVTKGIAYIKINIG